MSETSILSPTEDTVKEHYKLYMREYMKTRYKNDIEKNRAISKTNKCKRTHNISNDECKKYGIYLADIIRFRKILKTVPIEFITEIIQNQPVINTF